MNFEKNDRFLIRIYRLIGSKMTMNEVLELFGRFFQIFNYCLYIFFLNKFFWRKISFLKFKGSNSVPTI